MNNIATLESLFAEALAKPPAERAAFLDEACQGDFTMLRQLERMLAAEADLGSFLERPAIVIAGHDATEDYHPITERPGDRIGRYKLLQQIGEGGFGIVYMAEQERPVRRKVALKIIKPGMDTKEVIARFESERQALALMDHPNIAKVLDAGTTGEGASASDSWLEKQHSSSPALSTSTSRSTGRPYFVMELVRGLPITDYCDESRLSVEDRLQLFIQVCHAVQHAHQKGIIHRDLKPSNVMVTLHDDRPVPKVIDFGVAKAISQQLTEKTLFTAYGQMIGTPAYMSPEQAVISGLDIDTRSDVYSLGVLLYELLTGTTPLTKERLKSASFDEMRRIIREEEPETVSARIARTRRASCQLAAHRRQHAPRDESPRDAAPRVPKVSPAERGIGVSPVQNHAQTSDTAPHASTNNIHATSTPTILHSPRPSSPHLSSLPLNNFRELDWITSKSLEKDRERRYESPSALAADVQRYLSDEPVLACPPSLSYRLLKVARRHKTIAVTTAIVSFTILGSAAFSAHKYFDERTARRESDAQQKIAFENAVLAKENAAEATRERSEALRQKAEAERQRDAVRQNLYYADIRLAPFDIGLSNVGRAREALLSHFPNQGEVDRRSWEWYYLLGQSHEAEQALYGQRSEISTIAWSPDGRNIASTSQDGSACVWDTKTWKILRRFDAGSTLKEGIDWSPDSKKLAWGSASDESALRIWDRETDNISLLHGHAQSIWGVTWSHSGKFLATCSISGSDTPKEPGNVRVWDVEQLVSVAQITVPPQATSNVSSVSWSPDDKLLAVAAEKDSRIVWDIATQQQLIDDVMAGASCAFWHPRKQQLAVGDRSGNCLLWDHDSHKVILRWKAHQGRVNDLKWSSDASRLLSAGGDGLVKVWDPESGKELRSASASIGSTNSVAWSPTGKQFASGGTDAVIRVFASQPRPSPLVIDSQLRGSLSLAWDNEDSAVLLASGSKGKVVAFNATSGAKQEEVAIKQDANQRLVSFAHIVERSDNPGAESITRRVTDVPASGILSRVVPPATLNGGLFGHEKVASDGVLSPDRARIAYFSRVWPGLAMRATVWQRHDNRVVQCLEMLNPVGLAWSPDSQRLAVVGCGEPTDGGTEAWAGWVHVFEVKTGSRVRKLRIGSARVGGTAVTWSHDGRRIAASNEQGLCEIWELESGRKLLSEQVHSTRVNDLSWSPDDLRIASAGNNQQIHLWDSATGQQLLSLDSHAEPIRQIRWSPNGRKLAAVSEDGVIKVWDATAGYLLPERELWRNLLEPRDWQEYFRLISEQRWSEVADLLHRMIAAGNADYLPLYRLAHVSLQLDDQAGYRVACQRMLSTFADHEGLSEANGTAWICVLRPGALEDYSLAIRLARHAYDLRFKSGVLVGYQETLGAVLLRAGQYEEALQHLQTANEAPADRKVSPARLAYLLALTHHHLRHEADARMWLHRGHQEAERELNDSLQQPTWIQRLNLQLFQDEAARLIGPQTAEDQPSRADQAKKRNPRNSPPNTQN